MNSIKLGKRVINNNSEPYIIAEIGVNHEGSFEQAVELINLAKEGGADAVKFQSYKAETLASINSPAYWDTEEEKTTSQFNLFKKYDKFNFNDYESLAKHCKIIDIDFVSTPFDKESVEYLDKLVPYYKIASADINCIPLLRQVGSKKKSVIISTGCANINEIELAKKTLEDAGAPNVIILHCILNYPTNIKNANLSMITDLKEKFKDSIIGYSDHTRPDENMTTLSTAYLLGALIIEKHFTNNKTLPGNDHYHSMDINDLKVFRKNSDQIKQLKGSIYTKQPIKEEVKSRTNARRSIFLKSNLNAGDIIKEEDITFLRPGFGITVDNWDKVIGKRINLDGKSGYMLKWSDIND